MVDFHHNDLIFLGSDHINIGTIDTPMVYISEKVPMIIWPPCTVWCNQMGTNFCGDVVLYSFSMVYSDEDSRLIPKISKANLFIMKILNFKRYWRICKIKEIAPTDMHHNVGDQLPGLHEGPGETRPQRYQPGIG